MCGASDRARCGWTLEAHCRWRGRGGIHADGIPLGLVSGPLACSDLPDTVRPRLFSTLTQTLGRVRGLVDQLAKSVPRTAATRTAPPL